MSTPDELVVDIGTLSPSERTAAAREALEFESRALLVLVLDSGTRLLYASSEWSTLTSSSVDDVLGLPLRSAIAVLPMTQGDRRALELGISGALGPGAVGERTEPLRLCLDRSIAAREPRFLEGRVYGPRIETGHYCVVFHDRTSELLALAVLAEDERRFRMVAKAAQDMVTETNEAGRFTYVSKACTDVLGYEAADLVGNSPLLLHHVDDLPGFTGQLSREREPDRPFHVAPHRLQRRDGSWIWAEATGMRYRRADGEVRTIGVARDISARREQEATRRLLEEQVRRAQKLESLGILAAGIAHDFNNLLTPIVGAAGVLASEIAEDAPQRRMVDTICKAAARATDLTSQMLSYAGKNEPKLDRVDVSEVIRDMELLLESAASQRVHLVYELGDSTAEVRADRSQIGQVVMNLVANAAEALSGAEGRIQLSTGNLLADRALLDRYQLGSQREEGQYVYLEVRDNGIGIAGDTRERIFDPFFSTKFTGRGLGLAVVLGIVDGHGGALRIESEPGEGTCFHILLPALGSAAAEGAIAARVAPPRASGRELGTLLVVDDDEGAREVASMMLIRAGFEVASASDGSQALEIFCSSDFEIRAVVLDNTMPGMSGARVLDALREVDPDMPVLLVSGYTREAIPAALLEREGVRFLRKPFADDGLVDAVWDLLEASGAP